MSVDTNDDPDEFGRMLAEVTDDPQLAQRMRRAIERNRDLLDRIAGLAEQPQWFCCDGNVVDGRKQHVPRCTS